MSGNNTTGVLPDACRSNEADHPASLYATRSFTADIGLDCALSTTLTTFDASLGLPCQAATETQTKPCELQQEWFREADGIELFGLSQQTETHEATKSASARLKDDHSSNIPLCLTVETDKLYPTGKGQTLDQVTM